MHWINAIAMIILIMSGFEIYNDEIIFHWLIFPKWAVLGPWMAPALLWHFFAMWILGLNGIAYIVYGVLTGRFRRKLFPLRLGEVLATVREALTFRLGHDDITRYNAVQKLLYLSVITVAIVQVMTGLAIWKPVQFPTLHALFYDFQTARLLHFLGMAAIVGFIAIHVSLALVAPKTLLAMLTGGPRVPSRSKKETGQ
jgi:thiosulfate reductase cytochrome b subunit